MRTLCRLQLLLAVAISSVGPLGLDVVVLTAHLRITSGKMFNASYIFIPLFYAQLLSSVQKKLRCNKVIAKPDNETKSEPKCRHIYSCLIFKLLVFLEYSIKIVY